MMVFTNLPYGESVITSNGNFFLTDHFPVVVYDISGGSGDRNCVVLNDIHIDIMDYILPASCTDTEFRQMWAEFEWEKKVLQNISTF